MKTLITLLAIAFSANSFAHGTYLNPSQKTVLAPFFGTSLLAEATYSSSNVTSSKHYAGKMIIEAAQEYHQSGIATPALAESMKNIQDINEVSDDEAVDMLVDMAQELMN